MPATIPTAVMVATPPATQRARWAGCEERGDRTPDPPVGGVGPAGPGTVANGAVAVGRSGGGGPEGGSAGIGVGTKVSTSPFIARKRKESVNSRPEIGVVAMGAQTHS